MIDRPPWPLLILTTVALGLFVHAAAPDETADCLACHADKGRVIEFPEGGGIEAYVDEGKFRASVHNFLACTDCHPRSLVGQGHPQQRFRSEEVFKLRYSRICRNCHLDQEIGSLEVHASLLKQEAEGHAPVCTDCHPAHAIMPVAGGQVLAGETSYCLQCHEELAQAMGPAAPAAAATAPPPAAHGNLNCSGCHAGYSRSLHPGKGPAAAGVSAAAPEDLCRRCHFDKYTKTLEGIHYKLHSQGHPQTPGCIDCHGAHQITSLSHDRAGSAAKCGECHPQLYSRYATSVHGGALVNSNNQDVPICIDCHRAHDIGDPLTDDYRDDIPLMCGNCHASKAIAGKYGLSTDVVKTYLSDFHGSAVSLYHEQGSSTYRPRSHIAVCTDCHGTHDIKSMSALGPGEIKRMLLGKCRQCHEGASADFPDAWLSHYAPSMSTAPVLFILDRAYEVVLPLILLGILLQVLLHARRYAAGHAGAAKSGEGSGVEGGPVRIRRFSAGRIAEHLLLIVLFVALASTGLAQTFHHLEASQWLFSLLGGVDIARRVHHYAGMAFAVLLLAHVVTATWGVTMRGWPPSMLVSRQDVLDAMHDVRYGLGLADRPADRDRYDYKEKFTYWLVLTGGLIMVLTGLILWFPVTAVRYLPGEAIPIAALMHSKQALVVLLLAAAWHIYDSIFSPDVFPLNTSIFTGYTTQVRTPRGKAEEQRAAGRADPPHERSSNTEP
jgi:formate dehydrogenase gamma subunit